MTVWDELRPTLVRLLEERPGALTGYPDPNRSEGGQPPYAIRLAPWAEAVAAELSRRFGDDVDLIVGALPFPPGREAGASRSRWISPGIRKGTSPGGLRSCR